MVRRATDDGADGSPSIGQLAASIKDDLTSLVRDEIELAKAELREDARAAAIGGAAIAVAGLLGLLAVLLGSFAVVYGVHALGLGLGWSFLVVAGGYLLLAVILLVVAKGRFGRMTGAARSKAAAQRIAGSLRPPRRQT